MGGAKIPVFFLRDESGAVHVENGEGLFFMSPGDAKEKLKELRNVEGTKVKQGSGAASIVRVLSVLCGKSYFLSATNGGAHPADVSLSR